MVRNALKAIKEFFKPRYRVILEMSEGGAVFAQRKSLIGDKWHYVSDVFGAIEFESIMSAFCFIEVTHEGREYEVSLLIRFEDEKDV